MLTRLILSYTAVDRSLQDVLFPLTALQVLSLRSIYPIIFRGQETLFLSDLLCQLSCLQELDVIGFDQLAISAAECSHVKLASFSFEFDQLFNLEQSSFEHYGCGSHPPTSATASKPFLRMDGSFANCPFECWVYQFPFWALTYLTMHDAQEWPSVFTFLPDRCLQQLRVLDIRFSESFNDSDETVCVSSQLRLTDRYIAGSRLCLYDVLSASTDLALHNLDDLISIKLGGVTAGKDVTRELPSLPHSTVELDLWNGLFTGLEQLTRLTNLKKLTVPDPVTEQQLQIVQKLRQLRWAEVTHRQGMRHCDNSIVPPWIDQ